jgi:precorrin-6B methylase 2
MEVRATGIFLDALAALGLLTKEERDYGLSPLSRTYLLPSSPRYFGGMIAFDGCLWDLWGRLEEAIRSGNPVRRTGMFQENEAETGRFIGAMDSLVQARGDADYLSAHLDLRQVSTLLDIGSGPGSYPIAFCKAHPDLKVTIFDLPGTLDVTRRYIEKAGLEDRIRWVAGDYNRDPLPAGHDLVFLSNVIHGEDEGHNRALMKKIHASLKPGGEVILKDHILDETMTQPAAGAIFSLMMLMTTHAGRDYGLHEVRAWLEEAGFHRVRETVLPSPMTSSLVRAVKP